MRRLTPIVLACSLPVFLGGCGLLNKIAQPPMRLMQAGARTLSDAGDHSTPASREAGSPLGVALRSTTEE